MPPSLVERPLMPWPPLRTASGTSCARANASASATSPASPRAQHEPGRAGADVGRADLRVAAVARLDGRRPPATRAARRSRCRRGAAPGHARRGPGRDAVPAAARSRATASRSAGATSCAEALDRARVVAARMNVLKPCSSTSGSSSSTHCSGGPQEAGARRTCPEVQQPPDLARVAAGGLRRLVDRCALAAAMSLGLQVARATAASRRPCAPVRREHPRLVGAEPDRDVVRRLRAALGAVDAVVLAVARARARRVVRPRSRG